MTNRERALSVLRYQPVDRMPLVYFGFWHETLQKWAAEGHIRVELAKGWGDGNAADFEIAKLLGFDFNWQSCFSMATFLKPYFESVVMETLPDGTQHIRNGLGVTVTSKAGAGSIPAETDHLLKDRASWEEHYKPRLQWDPSRVEEARVRIGQQLIPFGQGGMEALRDTPRDWPLSLHCGSLMGTIRNIVGMENLCYLEVDDPDLLFEIIDTVADLCYRCAEHALKRGGVFDFGHFWEDICFKNGPLVRPQLFAEKVGPHYRRITELLNRHGLDIVSLDCDGQIDALIPTWLDNGVNTMFPIEVGTWNASIEPWRATYGKRIRGVGGMNKTVFSRDRKAVDAEVSRLMKLVELGGFIPCPDHRIAPDAEWDNVRYYADRMRAVLGA
jgi:hypothetical protein